VEATLHSIDNALTLAANWMLELRDMEKSLEETILVKITVDDIKSFQDNVGIPFVSTLKTNISSRFGSQDVVQYRFNAMSHTRGHCSCVWLSSTASDFVPSSLML